MPRTSPSAPRAPAISDPAWKLESAKTHFSELVRRARTHGPQRVTVRGQDAVVIVSAADYARLAPSSQASLADLFGGGPFARLDDFDTTTRREHPSFRDPPAF